MQPIVLNGMWEYTTALDDPTQLDSATWETIAVPHNWALNGLGNHPQLWLRTRFTMPPNDACSVWWLECVGVNDQCTIWLNGSKVGAHQGGTTRFRMDVTHAVMMETNTLLLHVTCTETTEPQDGSLLTELPVNAGGVWGQVALTPYDCAQPPQADDWYLPCETPVVAVDPHTWQWTRGAHNHPFFPRGTTYMPSRLYSQLSREIFEQDIRLMKDANFNMVRVLGGLLPDAFYDVCEDLGILVWQDLPPGEHWQDAMRQVWHRLCVAVWGADSEAQASAARQLDPQRYTFVVDMLNPSTFDWWKNPQVEPSCGIVMGYSAPALPEDIELTEPLIEDALNHYPAMQHLGVVGDGTPQTVIQQTQKEQAQTLKYATEYYRQQKTEQVRGIFQHTFVDSVPGISTSVLDVDRHKKVGYAALKAAMQPLLPIAKMPIETIPVVPYGQDVPIDVLVINDLPQAFEGWSCKVSMTGWIPSAESDDSQTFMHHWSHLFTEINIPPSALIELGRVVIPPLPRRQLVYHLVLQLFKLEDEHAPSAVNTYILQVAR